MFTLLTKDKNKNKNISVKREKVPFDRIFPF